MNEFDFSVLTAGEPAQFGKYGSLRLRYLKENKPTLYQALLQGHFFDTYRSPTFRGIVRASTAFGTPNAHLLGESPIPGHKQEMS